MKIFKILFLFSFCTIFSQRIIPVDSLKMSGVQDFFTDDYGSIYLYKNKDFSFTKYDSLGKQLGKMMMTVPYKIQNIQNPLNIVLFSENAQEMKFVDQNLNEIQKVDFRQRFGFIKSAYAEDLQQVWMLEESTKRLLQYNFRNDVIVNSYAMNFDVDHVLDILVFEGRLYMLQENKFSVYNFRSEKLFEATIENGKRLRRENDAIFVISKNIVSRFVFPKDFQKTFQSENSEIVDKNSSSYFEWKDNKLYLYKIK